MDQQNGVKSSNENNNNDKVSWIIGEYQLTLQVFTTNKSTELKIKEGRNIEHCSSFLASSYSIVPLLKWSRQFGTFISIYEHSRFGHDNSCVIFNCTTTASHYISLRNRHARRLQILIYLWWLFCRLVIRLDVACVCSAGVELYFASNICSDIYVSVVESTNT